MRGIGYGQGTYFEDFAVGDVYRSAIGRTVTEGGQRLVHVPDALFAGDTIWSESEILALRESKSSPSVGIVSARTRGVNKRGEVVCEYRRSFMIPKRDAAPASGFVPAVTEWTV